MKWTEMGYRGKQALALGNTWYGLLRNCNFILNAVGAIDYSDQIRKFCGTDGFGGLVGLSAGKHSEIASNIQTRNDQGRREVMVFAAYH